MTAPQPSKPEPSRADLAASVAEVAGLTFISVAAFFVAMPLGLAVMGVALFVLGFFGLAS